MITRVKGLKISQVPELKEITGEEMIPYQYKCTNGKISASTLASYISDNLDPNDPTGEIGQLREDVDNLTDRVDNVENNVSSIENQVNTNTNDIKDILDLIDSGTIGGGDADYVKKLLDEFKATKGQPDGLASLDSEGKLNQDQLPDNVINVEGFQPITYEQLKSKVDNGQLEPGVNYGITDYSCIYIQPITDIEMEVPATDFEYIICTAITNNKLKEEVLIIRSADKKVTISEAKYVIDPEQCSWTAGMVQKHPKGTITYLKDSSNNSANYDFKHIKFRRWAVTDVTANDTPDDGTNVNTSPFRCFVNPNTRNISDNRIFCGAGHPDEPDYIRSIFNGTWRLAGLTEPTHKFASMARNSGVDQPLYPYHEDYIKRCIKPYQMQEYPYDKYIAWQTDMYAKNGVSANGIYDSGATWMGGMANIVVDADDYVDRYTFDWEGEDATDMLVSSPSVSNYVLCSNNSLEKLNLDKFNVAKLPNTVIAISKDIVPTSTTIAGTTTTLIMNNKFIGFAYHNTILLTAEYSESNKWCQLINNVFGDGYGSYIRNNLILVKSRLYNNTINDIRYNYIVGGIVASSMLSLLSSVWFGYFSSIHGNQNRCNLWFGSCYTIKDTVNNWYTAKDGERWYDIQFTEWMSGNIMSPFQYSNFYSHINGNTFISTYNKGATFYGGFQYNVSNTIKWGTKIDYSTFKGQYLQGITHSTIPAAPLQYSESARVNGHSTIEGFNIDNIEHKIPVISSTDWKLTYAVTPAEASNAVMDVTMGVDAWSYPVSRRVLYKGSDGVVRCVPFHQLVEGTSTISAFSLENEEDQQMLNESFVQAMRDEYPDKEADRPYTNEELFNI